VTEENIVSRQQDLEDAIRESFDLIREYEAIIRTSDRPEEKARARRILLEQRALVDDYQAELANLPDPSATRLPVQGPQGGQIFVSYDHRDGSYARKLAAALRQRGFQVWIDDRLDPSTSWPRTLQEQLDASAAVIVLMTSGAYTRDWVQNELARAQAKGIPLFPLLLEGDVWLALQSTQYEDVRGGKLPSERFYQKLATVVGNEAQ
jgi:hypothetical protein